MNEYFNCYCLYLYYVKLKESKVFLFNDDHFAHHP